VEAEIIAYNSNTYLRQIHKTIQDGSSSILIHIYFIFIFRAKNVFVLQLCIYFESQIL
jgi:hypothetical protein